MVNSNRKDKLRQVSVVTFFEDITDWQTIMDRGRALCLDYGDKRTGVAISDSNWVVATPLTVINTVNIYTGVLNLIKEYRIGLILVGMPLALNGGTEGAQHKVVNKFTDKLQTFLNESNCNVDIMQYDERLSSVVANRILSESEFTIKKRQRRVDKIAACFVLQGFLDRVRYKLYEN